MRNSPSVSGDRRLRPSPAAGHGVCQRSCLSSQRFLRARLEPAQYARSGVRDGAADDHHVLFQRDATVRASLVATRRTGRPSTGMIAPSSIRTVSAMRRHCRSIHSDCSAAQAGALLSAARGGMVSRAFALDRVEAHPEPPRLGMTPHQQRDPRLVASGQAVLQSSRFRQYGSPGRRRAPRMWSCRARTYPGRWISSGSPQTR